MQLKPLQEVPDAIQTGAEEAANAAASSCAEFAEKVGILVASVEIQDTGNASRKIRGQAVERGDESTKDKATKDTLSVIEAVAKASFIRGFQTARQVDGLLEGEQ